MTPITVYHYLALAAILFVLGLVGVIIRRNLLVVFMCVEVLLNSVNLTFIALARYLKLMDGHVVAFFVMAIAAAEAAVGLAIITTLFRTRRTIKSTDWRILGG